jgi:hypothetical protein
MSDWSRARVNIDYHVAFDSNLYSVPYNWLILSGLCAASWPMRAWASSWRPSWTSPSRPSPPG